MMIYTGMAFGSDLEEVRRLGMGIMISSSPNWSPSRDTGTVPCCLDNGAYSCWRRGYPFMGDVFMDSIRKCHSNGISLEFIVCPDIVAGGEKSLDYSMEWAMGELKTAPRLALAVQDGMSPDDITMWHREWFSWLFVGGTPEWKWSTAESWVNRAHSIGMKCHIGSVGTLNRLRAAANYGADSVDSTSFQRNKSWHIVEEFMGGRQASLMFGEGGGHK
jgi:hypothetical protein